MGNRWHTSIPLSGNVWIHYVKNIFWKNSGKVAMRHGKYGSKNMRVLVTGHNGYVGTIMVPMLEEAGYDIVGLDSNLYEGSTFGEMNLSLIHISEPTRLGMI